MESQNILDYFVSFLDNKGADTKEFKTHWATLKSNDRLPCPICFTENNKISYIISLSEKDGCEPLKCEECKFIFNMPIPS